MWPQEQLIEPSRWNTLETANGGHVEPSEGAPGSMLRPGPATPSILRGESAGTVSDKVRKDEKSVGRGPRNKWSRHRLLCLTLRQAELGRVEALCADSPSSRKVGWGARALGWRPETVGNNVVIWDVASIRRPRSGLFDDGWEQSPEPNQAIDGGQRAGGAQADGQPCR